MKKEKKKRKGWEEGEREKTKKKKGGEKGVKGGKRKGNKIRGDFFPKARAAAQKAISKASAQGATLMMARGYGILCQQDSSNWKSMDQSVAECDLARNSYISAGDQNNAARHTE